jgi:hypothetical protein
MGINPVKIALILLAAVSAAVAAEPSSKPNISIPVQSETFFQPDRLQFKPEKSSPDQLIEPLFSVSKEAREEERGMGGQHTTHRVHGEAGGKINLFGDASLSAVAKIPVYSYDVTDNDRNIGGTTTGGDLLRNNGRLSWRSELGLPISQGVNLNLFYDSSIFGRIDKPGVEEREEKFGTRFIIRFK